MNLQVSDVAAYLRSRHVRVLDEWTAECLDWLKQEYRVKLTSQSYEFFIWPVDKPKKEI